MKTILGIVGALFWLVLVTAPNIWASDACNPVATEKVAEAFGYSGTLDVTDITDLNRRINNKVIWSGMFRSRDNTFASVTLTIAAGQSILTTQLAAQLEEISDRTIKLPSGQLKPPTAHRIDLADGGSGFVFLSGFGPGGCSYSAVVTSADRRIDVAIAVNIASATAIQSTEQTEAHKTLVSGNVLGLVDSAARALYASAVQELRGTGRDDALSPASK